MSSLVTYAVVFIVLMAALVPPIALALSVFRYFRRRRGIIGAIRLVIATSIGCIPIAINMYFLSRTIPSIWSGTFQFDALLGAALIISWATFWLKIAFRRFRRKRSIIY